MCISEKRRRWITGAERKINLLPSVSRSPFWFIWQNKPREGRRCTLVFVSPVYDIVVIPRLETNRRPLRMTDHRYVITRICTLQTFCSVPKIVPTDISRASYERTNTEKEPFGAQRLRNQRCHWSSPSKSFDYNTNYIYRRMSTRGYSMFCYHRVVAFAFTTADVVKVTLAHANAVSFTSAVTVI